MQLTQISNAAFYFCNELSSVIFPPALTKIEVAAFETGDHVDGTNHGCYPSPVKTIIWQGCTSRPAIGMNGIDPIAFFRDKMLDQLSLEGMITEIFIP